jgi:hypothetical protein
MACTLAYARDLRVPQMKNMEHQADRGITQGARPTDIGSCDHIINVLRNGVIRQDVCFEQLVQEHSGCSARSWQTDRSYGKPPELMPHVHLIMAPFRVRNTADGVSIMPGRILCSERVILPCRSNEGPRSCDRVLVIRQ